MARNPQQNDKMRADRQEKIRAAALKQFAAQGMLAARITDIAADAGMAQGLLYHYYPSKDAIFVDLINDALDRINKASLSLQDMKAPAREKIIMALQELFKTIGTSKRFSETCRLIAQATNSTAIPADAQRSIEEKRDLPYQVMAEIMADGQREGTVIAGDPRMLATLFWTSVNGLAIYYVTRPDPGPIPDYRILASMFFNDKIV